MLLKFRKSALHQQMEIIETSVNDFEVHKQVPGTTFDNMWRLDIASISGASSFEIHHFLHKNQSSLLSLTPPC